MLYLEGATVVVYDPEANSNAHRVYPDLDYASSLEEAVDGAEVVLLLTEWDEFRDADPAALGFLVSERRIIDARNVLDVDAYRSAGWELRALGRSAAIGTPVAAERDAVA
jgi:UDPglucose 6-dehydrogenase